MLKSPQVTRSAVIAATILSLAASPALAREADRPLHPGPAAAVAQHSRQWTQPRTDAIGSRLADQPVASPAPAVSLTRAPDASGGTDWLLIAIGSAALVALLLAGVALTSRHRAHPFRARQI